MRETLSSPECFGRRGRDIPHRLERRTVPCRKGSLRTQCGLTVDRYFAALGIPLLRGCLFDEHDRPDVPLVALINDTAARKFFPNEDPIGAGHDLRFSSSGWYKFAERVTSLPDSLSFGPKSGAERPISELSETAHNRYVLPARV